MQMMHDSSSDKDNDEYKQQKSKIQILPTLSTLCYNYLIYREYFHKSGQDLAFVTSYIYFLIFIFQLKDEYQIRFPFFYVSLLYLCNFKNGLNGCHTFEEDA